MENSAPICDLAETGGSCSEQMQPRTSLNPAIVSHIKKNSGIASFETVCEFHRIRLGILHRKCIDLFNVHPVPAMSVSKVNSEMRAAFENMICSTTIVIGDPLCRNCKVGFSDLIASFISKESSQMTPKSKLPETPNSKIRKACGDLDCATPPKIDKRDNSKVKEKKIDVIVEGFKSGISKKLFKLPNVELPEFSTSNLNMTDFYDELKLKLANCKTYADKVQILTLAHSSWTIPECVTFFEVSEHMVKKARKLGILEKPAPRKGNRIPQEKVDVVIEYYNENADDLSSSKHTIDIGENGAPNRVGKKLLNVTLDELFSLYKRDRLAIGQKAIGRTKFIQLRPKNIMLADSSGVHSFCVCIYHQNIELMLNSLPLPKKSEKYWFLKMVTCDNPSDACALSKCSKCPGEIQLRLELEELIGDDEKIGYYQWGKKSDEDKRCALNLMNDDKDTFLTKFFTQLTYLKRHHYIWQYQRNYFKNLKLNVKENEVIVHVDFAENFTAVYQNEVQSKYFTKDQVTLHNVVAYFKLNGVNEHLSMSVISDHMNHCTAAVHAFLKPIFEHLTSVQPKIDTAIMFSDGSAAQYKNRKNIASLVRFKENFNLNVEWHYSASCHGKGAVDGIGASIKQSARNDSLRGARITNAQELHSWAEKRMKNIKTFLVTSETVLDFEKKFQAMIHNALPIEGIQSLHCFVPNKNGEVEGSFVSGGERKSYKVFPCYKPLVAGDLDKMIKMERLVYVAYGNAINGKCANVGLLHQSGKNNIYHVMKFNRDGAESFKINGTDVVKFESIKAIIPYDKVNDDSPGCIKIIAKELNHIDSFFA